MCVSPRSTAVLTVIQKRTFWEVEQPVVPRLRAFSDTDVACVDSASVDWWRLDTLSEGKADCLTDSTASAPSSPSLGASEPISVCRSLAWSDCDDSEDAPAAGVFPPGRWSDESTGDCAANAPRFAEGAVVMLRNLPRKLTRQLLLDTLDQQGFQGSYDFLYLPRDMRKQVCFGYAFINWVSEDHATAALRHFDGFSAWPVAQGDRPCKALLNDGGLSSVLERLQGSAVLRPETPDEFKPLIMSNGSLVPLTR